MNKVLPNYEQMLSDFIDNTLPVAKVEELLDFVHSDAEAYHALLELPQLREKLERLAVDPGQAVHEAVSVRMKSRLLDSARRADLAVVHYREGRDRRVNFIRPFRWAAAAILIGVISFVGWLVFRDHRETGQNLAVQTDIKAPEKNKATITLPNGKQVLLDTVANGTLIAGIARKTADGQLVFEEGASAIAYIITSNPRNSQAMHITLPDATEVWLNADTYLQYPTNYNKTDRLVSLKGEAYFDVKHNASRPFRVTAGQQIIEDIGTRFNVKAYADEAMVKTTLVDGVVKINNEAILKPGQQYANGKIANANLDEVLSWKNGSFFLNQREFGEVAKDISRWYDVEVVFENEQAKHNVVFGGEMGRDLSLSQATQVLREMNVDCTLQDKKLVVK